MAQLPNPKSYEQILGDILATYMSKIGVNDLNVGSAVTSFFEAVAQMVYRASGDTFAILREFSVDRAEGEALQRIAIEERIAPLSARVATGSITISDSSFEKISTKIYAGGTPPNVGSTLIKVSDASEFTATGALYIGRGTPNIEGPISYSSILQVGSYWEITLTTPTTKYHNLSESVILAQGGTRTIPSGTGVKTVGSGSSIEVAFSTLQAATILDGEVEISGVPVAAQIPGSSGNVPRNSIRQFLSAPFSGATVTNDSPLTTGRDVETDDDLRTRIKKGRISRGLGTKEAIKNAVTGAQADDESATVTSTEIFSADDTTLFIDNGEGYEERYEGVGLEFIVDSALGGETHFQLETGGSQTSIVKAFLESAEESPFEIYPNDRLAILVGGILNEHIFADGDFRSNGSATSFEIVSSINANPNIDFVARTIDSGTKITIQAKEETDEYLQKTNPTTGTDASIALGLASSEVETLKLYKNKNLLSRSGRSATVESENQTDWSNTIISGDDLIISVDGTDPITYTLTNNDFLNEGTHTTVSKNNTLQSWVNVLNNKITGITASINGNRIVLSSNLGPSSRASIEIDETSDLVTKGIFTLSRGLTSQGKESDFILSRNTAQFKLKEPLESGDNLTAGTEFTRAEIVNEPILGGNVGLSSDANLWFIVDDKDAMMINHGVVSDTLISVSKLAGNVIRYKSSVTNAFGSLQVGDYFIIWSTELNSFNRLEGRVNKIGTESNTNDYFEVVVTASEYSSASNQSNVTFLEGIAFVRTIYPPQKVKISSGSYNINQIADLLSDGISGASINVENDQYLNIRTKTYDITGAIMLVTFNEPAKNLNFSYGDFSASTFSHVAAQETLLKDDRFPLFVHSSVTADRTYDPPNTFIPDFDSALNLPSLGIDQNSLICFLHPYLVNSVHTKDAQAANECVQVDNIAGTVVDIENSNLARRLRIGDRFFVASPYDFGYNDSFTVILDDDASNKTFPIPLYRRAITNTTMPTNADEFRAYDIESGATTQFEQFFGSSFSFENYKAFMQAKNIIDPSSGNNEDAILFKSTEWGSAGEKINVGYIYPTVANQDIEHTILTNSNVKIRISLKSGNPVSNNIDGTTEWDVTVTPTTPNPGTDEVTFTWNGIGNNPLMTTLMAGHFVNINSSGEFSAGNTGVFRISSATSTSFTVRMPTGQGVAENNKATLTTSTISLYENDDTTAEEIVDYINDNLSDWISASLLDDSGLTGAGVIFLSTYEDTEFSDESVQFVDGENFIEVSDLPAIAPNPQFNFKNTLSLYTYDTNTLEAYKFSNGQEVRLIPTTAKAISEFISVLAVSGITTLGSVDLTSRGDKVQISTQTFGDSGSVKIPGGTGNESLAQIRGTAIQISGSDFTKISIDRSSSSGIHAGQWVKLVSENIQKKVTGISFTTQVTITPDSPSLGLSTVEFANKDVTDRYFGQARTNVRTRGRVFHVEKHGSLVCVSWNNSTGGNPLFSKTVEINNDGGNMMVNYNSDTLSTEYTVTTGSRKFNEANIGDTVVLQNFANSANNGTFIINGISDDALTISVDNSNGVNAASAAVANGDVVITTEIKEGDTVDMREPFASLNIGKFRVIRRFENSFYIENDSAVEERVFMSDNLRSTGFSGTTQFNVTIDGDMKIQWNGNGTQPDFSSVRMGDNVTIGTAFNINNRGTFMVTDSGSNFIKCANAKVVAESNIVVSSLGGDVLEIQNPGMVFSEYEASVYGDRLVISGNVLTGNNKGSYTVTDVISKKKIIVDGTMTSQTGVQLNDSSVQVYIEEEIPYYGYKKIYNKFVDTANNLRTCLVFENKNQINKVNEASATSIYSVNKLGFSTGIIRGIDAYKFHTGLIAKSNKIVYGDPRNSTTYPGVAAAGAEIFIEPPLVRKIEIGISVRVKTGVPFTKIVEQVRSNVAALVNSTAIGQSIAISDIVATVNAIPGVTAVSISSPSYSPTNDVIVVNPSEKPFILDIVNNITVNKVE